MQSILVVSKDKDARRDYVISLCQDNDIDRIDMGWYSFDKTVGIEDIRNLQRKIILKPIKSKTKGVFIDSNIGFTIEAQNALLKILEEPPSSTVMCISTSNKNLMLPTILSRCKTIELEDRGSNLSEEEIAQHLDILKSLPKKLVGEKLKLAQDITRNKESVLPWLEKMIMAARYSLLSNYKIGSSITIHQSPFTQLINTLISFQKAYTIIKTTNANQRLILENLLLAL